MRCTHTGLIMCAVFLSAIALPAPAQQNFGPLVESKGEAQVEVMPDYVEFRFRLSKSGENVSEAAKAASMLEADVRAALKDREIPFTAIETQGPVVASILRPAVYYELTLQLPLAMYRTPDGDPSSFGTMCDSIAAMAKDLGCGFFGPKYGVTNPDTTEINAVARAVENAYPNAEAVAGAMKTEVTMVEQVVVDEVTWNYDTRTKETPYVGRVVCTAEVRVFYSCSPVQPR